ncbi:MAG: hypothetical protein KDA93_11765 [Planctomycetaceae bacterium]|nr:hypothetical protein [Planctomycetaceae bacterium]
MADREEVRTNDGNAPATPKASRVWTFVLAATLSLLVGSCFLCGVFLSSQWPTFEQDPDAAKALTSQLLTIEIPPNFEPQGTIDWNVWLFVHMRGTYYAHAVDDGELSLLEVDSRFINQPDFRQHIIDSLHQNGAGSGFELNVRKTETKEFTVQGHSVRFTFITAEDRTTGESRRLVDGVVTFDDRPILIALWVDEDLWDETMVTRLIESVGPPKGQ